MLGVTLWGVTLHCDVGYVTVCSVTVLGMVSGAWSWHGQCTRWGVRQEEIMYIERCAMCLDDDCELTECMQCGELFCENCHTYDGPDETPICECCLMEYEQDLEDEEEEEEE